MLSYAVFWIFLGHFVQIKPETVSSVPIRILDAAEKSSNLRPVIYGENRNREPSYSDYYYGNRYNDRDRGGGGGGGVGGGRDPFGSYVIYDDGPRKIFHRWNFNGNNWNRVPNWPTRKAEWISKPQDYSPYYKKDGYDFPKPKPTLSYQSVYSNTIKVYEEPPEDYYPNKKYTGETKLDYLKYEPPVKPDYEVHYPYSNGKKYYHDQKLPDNFPKIFSPNQGFRFTISEKPKPGPPKTFYADAGYYRTYTVNYAPQNESRSFNSPERKRSSCNLIRLGGQSFPERNELCSRSENMPLTLLDYPDYSKFSNQDIPMEHRRQNYFKADMPKGRGKRSAYGYGYGFDSWKGGYSPYERNFNDYSYYSYYPSYDSYNYDNNLYGNDYRNGYNNRYDRDRGFGYNNRYNSGGRYSSDYNDEYRNSEETTTRGLTAFLTNGGRRDKSRNNRGEEEDDEGEDSDEEYRSRRRDMFNKNNSNRNEEDTRNRQGSNKRRQNGSDSDEDGDEDRSGQSNYGRRNNNRGRYNSRNNDRYGNNRNRGSYGHNGNYGSSGNSGSYGSSSGYGSGGNGNYGSYGNYNSNGYGRSNGYGDSSGYGENRPFGLYG